jgi:cobalt/nickel transport system permease protein
MHISDGILSPIVLGTGMILTGTGTIAGLRKISTEKIMEISIVVSAFFVASLIHIPVGVTNAHLTLGGLAGLLLGEAVFPAILAGLVLQLLFFQFGGLLSLGVNTFNMAGPALFVYYLFGRRIRDSGSNSRTLSFIGGMAAVFLSTVLLCLSLILSDLNFLPGTLLIIGSNIPLMICEGFITMTIITFLEKVEPAMLNIHTDSQQEVSE